MNRMMLGKHPARHDLRTLLLRDHVTLPKPPDTVSWLFGKTSGWGMMDNDRLGDCTCAGLGHAVQTISGATGAVLTPPDTGLNSVQALYSGACGYVIGDESTDNGGNELDVLNYVRRTTLFGLDTLLAYADPNVGDQSHIQQAIAYMGGVYIGLALPDSVVVDVDMLTVPWTDTSMPANPNNGHAVWVAAYDQNNLYPITWGGVKTMSWDFWFKYCDESHAILTQNWLKEYGSLSGITVAAQSMLNALAG